MVDRSFRHLCPVKKGGPLNSVNKLIFVKIRVQFIFPPSHYSPSHPHSRCRGPRRPAPAAPCQCRGRCRSWSQSMSATQLGPGHGNGNQCSVTTPLSALHCKGRSRKASLQPCSYTGCGSVNQWNMRNRYGVVVVVVAAAVDAVYCMLY